MKVYDWELGKYFPKIIDDELNISTQKHFLFNFTDSHVKTSHFGKKKSLCAEDNFFLHRWERNAQLLEYVKYCFWCKSNNL